MAREKTGGGRADASGGGLGAGGDRGGYVLAHAELRGRSGVPALALLLGLGLRLGVFGRGLGGFGEARRGSGGVEVEALGLPVEALQALVPEMEASLGLTMRNFFPDQAGAA